MKVSARNQLKGKISNIVVGSVNNEVEITLDGGDKLTTIITKQSSDSLDLAIGKVAYAIIKAPWVVLADPTCKLKFSARNQLAGIIKKFTKGAVNSNVVVETDKGLNIIAVITRACPHFALHQIIMHAKYVIDLKFLANLSNRVAILRKCFRRANIFSTKCLSL